VEWRKPLLPKSPVVNDNFTCVEIGVIRDDKSGVMKSFPWMNQTTNWNSVGLTCVAQGNQNFQAKKEVLDYHTINKRGD